MLGLLAGARLASATLTGTKTVLFADPLNGTLPLPYDAVNSPYNWITDGVPGFMGLAPSPTSNQGCQDFDDGHLKVTWVASKTFEQNDFGAFNPFFGLVVKDTTSVSTNQTHAATLEVGADLFNWGNNPFGWTDPVNDNSFIAGSVDTNLETGLTKCCFVTENKVYAYADSAGGSIFTAGVAIANVTGDKTKCTTVYDYDANEFRWYVNDVLTYTYATPGLINPDATSVVVRTGDGVTVPAVQSGLGTWANAFAAWSTLFDLSFGGQGSPFDTQGTTEQYTTGPFKPVQPSEYVVPFSADNYVFSPQAQGAYVKFANYEVAVYDTAA